MKKLTTLLMTLMFMSTALWAEETVTVSANSSDISEGLDLKVVAKLFAEAKNLEEFETMLNNPDSAFCNLDLNGDGEVDYLRVVETGTGNKRLIVLQAILAKDIYQDVASIYVEKDESTNEVSVQVVGDEYVYGSNYIIEPVYVYRPVIYDWFWGGYWYAWRSPWYWGYYPGWWHAHRCWAHDWYWHRCYTYHHHHHWCSFRPGHRMHHGYHDLYHGVARRDYAVAHPDRSFSHRNAGMANAHEIRRDHVRSSREARGGGAHMASVDRRHDNRTFGSSHTAAARSERRPEGVRSESARGERRSEGARTETVRTERRSDGHRSEGSRTESARGSHRSTSAVGDSRRSSSSSSSSTRTSSSSSNSSTRSSGSSSSRSSGSSYSGGSHSSRTSGSYSGGSHGGSSRGGGHSGGGSRGGGGGGHRR